MKTIVKVLENKIDLLCGEGVDIDKIKKAEKMLGITFAKDYVEYLLKFGIAAYDGHELTGICKSDRVNVVSVTINNQQYNKGNIDLYVIEETNIDGIVIWQSKDGAIYKTIGQSEPMKIYDSFAEYVELV